MSKIGVQVRVTTLGRKTATELLMGKIGLAIPLPGQTDVVEYVSGGCFVFHDSNQGFVEPYLIDLTWYSELNNGTISIHIATTMKTWVIHVPITNIVFANEIINAAKRSEKVAVVWKKDAQNKIQLVIGIMHALPNSGEFYFCAKFGNGTIMEE